jgi:hypothetical protein
MIGPLCLPVILPPFLTRPFTIPNYDLFHVPHRPPRPDDGAIIPSLRWCIPFRHQVRVPVFNWNDSLGMDGSLFDLLRLVCEEMAFPYSAGSMPTYLSGESWCVSYCHPPSLLRLSELSLAGPF